MERELPEENGVLEEKTPSVTWSITHPTRPGIEPGTIRLSYGTAFFTSSILKANNPSVVALLQDCNI
jgi:hypothetical protein